MHFSSARFHMFNFYEAHANVKVFMMFEHLAHTQTTHLTFVLTQLAANLFQSQ